MIKRYGEIGSPCLIPLIGLKWEVCSPFTKIEIEEEEIQDIIRELSLGGTLKKERACLINLHSILSNAF